MRRVHFRRAAGVAAVAMCGFVLWHGVSKTRDLDWPHDQDVYRDLAQAQTIADGRFGEDPFYRGETLWYNPLAPCVVARLALLLDLPLGVAYTRLGAYLNLLAPACFYALVLRLLGPAVAVAALSSFLFLRDPAAPSYTAATYSPWLLSAHLAQPLFYSGLLALRAALLRGGQPRYAWAGLLVGLTFLAHTAPALILGGIALALVPFAGPRGPAPGWTRPLRRIGILVAAAAVVGLPLLWSIVGHYGLRVRNARPLEWNWPAFDAENARALLLDNLHPEQVVALLGLALAALRVRRRTDARLLVAWPAVCAALLGYSWVAAGARARGLDVPNLVPAFHFVFWGKAAESVLFGYGLRQMASAAVRAAAAVARGAPPPPRGRVAWVSGLLALCVLGLLARSLPAYPARADLVGSRHRARKFASLPGSSEARRWLRENTRADDVFLSTDELGLLIVGPSARKLVAIEAVYSNPYVRWDTRNAARDLMLQSLRSGATVSFRSLAREYHVTYVILASPGGRPVSLPHRKTVLEAVFAKGDILIFQVLRNAD